VAFDFKIKSLKAGFFDAKKIEAAAARADAKVQSKFGAYVRRTMKTSIKYKAKGSAPAGSPPFAHRSEAFSKEKVNKKSGATTRQQRSPLRELIFFARDPAANSVVIGPVAFGARGAGALETGGSVSARRGSGRKTVHIAPHPFARPAGEAEAKKMPELLRGAIN
jgi:hypothetical protein